MPTKRKTGGRMPAAQNFRFKVKVKINKTKWKRVEIEMNIYEAKRFAIMIQKALNSLVG